MLICALLTAVTGCGEGRLDDALAGRELTTAKFILTTKPGLARAADEDGRTRLHKAVIQNNIEAAVLLLDKGAEVNATDRYGYTALHYAAQRGYEDAVVLLAGRNASLEFRNQSGYTPLHCAAERGHAAVAEELIDRGADVFALDNNGRSPAQVAYEEGFLEVYAALLPAHEAAKKGDVERLSSLLRQHPDLVNARDYEGRTPLHVATRYGRNPAVELLVSRGADGRIKDNYGYTPDYYSPDRLEKRTGVNQAERALEETIDRLAYASLSKYDYVKVAAVLGGNIVFSRVYGESGLERDDVWGSVSKPLTAMLVMHLVSTGVLAGIDDPIWKYSPRYQNCMPAAYAGDTLTIRHLLTHTSGVPHNNEPTWKDGKLNLKFKPGAKNSYSTPGYGILGHVIEDVTGKSYSDAVKEYIGRPVGATSYWAENHFRAPGARIHSTVEDMARFALGVMNNTYVSSEMFYGVMLQSDGGPTGIGWGVTNKDSPDLVVFHGGSNGRPQAHLEIKPRKKTAVCILARAKDPQNFELNALSNQLLSALEKYER